MIVKTVSDSNNFVHLEEMIEQFLFYFGQDSPFSHWFKCKFTIDQQEFCCVEQYLMYKKALLFKDAEAAKKILRSSDPKRHRYIGKQVAGFDKLIWQRECKKYAFEANLAKFTQNISLMKMLKDTEGKSLAEASPYDRNWGIGLSVQNPKIYDRKKWRGKNWAGEVLEEVRSSIVKTTK